MSAAVNWHCTDTCVRCHALTIVAAATRLCLACALAPVPLPGIVLAALRDLRVELAVGDDAHAAGWRLALAVAGRDWHDSHERAAARGLATALAGGDLARARHCARWITDPDGAMESALASLGSGQAPTSVVIPTPKPLDLASLGIEAPARRSR